MSGIFTKSSGIFSERCASKPPEMRIRGGLRGASKLPEMRIKTSRDAHQRGLRGASKLSQLRNSLQGVQKLPLPSSFAVAQERDPPSSLFRQVCLSVD